MVVPKPCDSHVGIQIAQYPSPVAIRGEGRKTHFEKHKNKIGMQPTQAHPWSGQIFSVLRNHETNGGSSLKRCLPLEVQVKLR
jgi:hypothetical protein